FPVAERCEELHLSIPCKLEPFEDNIRDVVVIVVMADVIFERRLEVHFLRLRIDVELQSLCSGGVDDLLVILADRLAACHFDVCIMRPGFDDDDPPRQVRLDFEVCIPAPEQAGGEPAWCNVEDHMCPLCFLWRIFTLDLAEYLRNQLECCHLIRKFSIESHKNSPLRVRIPF